jgi:hypothetical protein
VLPIYNQRALSVTKINIAINHLVMQQMMKFTIWKKLIKYNIKEKYTKRINVVNVLTAII